MNRRRFVAAIVAGTAFIPVMHGLAQTPVPERQALEVATVGYRAPADDGIRTISARVSEWMDEDAADWFQEFLVREAGSDLPDGEFYQSSLEEWEAPDAPDDLAVTAIEWHTSVGVVGYVTEWTQLTMRRGSILWDIWISGAEREQLRELASSLMTVLGERYPPPCGTLELGDSLPQPEDVPDGMDMVEFKPGSSSDGERWLEIPDVPVVPPATPVNARCGAPD